MKEYKVVELKCNKDVKFRSYEERLREITHYNKVFFETDIQDHEKTQAIRRELAKYEHTVLHGVGKRPLTLFSNLGSAWLRENVGISEPLNRHELDTLIKFGDSAGIMKAGFVIIVFDEVEWKKGRIAQGTYGYEKACKQYGDDEYLGNAVILMRDNGLRTPAYFCTIVCESELRNEPSVDMLIKESGEILREATYYAPEGEEERARWDEIYRREKEKIDRLDKMKFERGEKHTENFPYIVTDKILSLSNSEYMNMPPLNVRPIARRVMKGSGWNPCKGRSMCYMKEADGKTVEVLVCQAHNGHILQALVTYSSRYFNFNYSAIYGQPLDEEEGENFFKNLLYILNIVEDVIWDGVLLEQ